VSLKTKKTKTIKEKNINNEITKYEINISALVKFSLNNEKENTINISSLGSYVAENNYSTTLSNEKTIVENLTENISERILEEINIKINDN